MPDILDPPALAVEVRHRIGTLFLDVSFRIASWPAVLFGPSGAGKSTLLRAIAGLIHPDQAAISFDHHRLGSQRGRTDPSLLQFVTQRPSLFPHLNVAQNVAFGLRSTPALGQREKVQEMLSLLAAEDLCHRMPGHLSGGERQRVAIARALAPGPRLLLLDEAFAGLDGKAKEEILNRLLPYLHKHSIASLHVTHEIGDAFALRPHVAVLQEGKVKAEGPAEVALARERASLLALLQSRDVTISGSD